MPTVPDEISAYRALVEQQAGEPSSGYMCREQQQLRRGHDRPVPTMSLLLTAVLMVCHLSDLLEVGLRLCSRRRSIRGHAWKQGSCPMYATVPLNVLVSAAGALHVQVGQTAVACLLSCLQAALACRPQGNCRDAGCADGCPPLQQGQLDPAQVLHRPPQAWLQAICMQQLAAASRWERQSQLQHCLCQSCRLRQTYHLPLSASAATRSTSGEGGNSCPTMTECCL